MQQILDRTQESLTQAFASLARNAKRQQHLYYATIGLLIAIVVISAVLLAGLAAARQLDYRRGHAAQYASSIALQLQNEASLLRRTTITVKYYLQAASETAPAAELLGQVRATGVGAAPDGRFTLLVPAETRAAWGSDLPHRVWQLQMIATAALSTQQALDLHHTAYVVDPGAAYAIVLSPDATPEAAAALRPGLVATLRDSLVRALRSRNGGNAPANGEQRWIGPGQDPLLLSPAMASVATVDDGSRQIALVASSMPVNTFFTRLVRPSDPATLVLLNSAEQRVDVSPPAPPALVDQIVAHARHQPPDTFTFTRSGMLLVQPLGPTFGGLVYFLSYKTLLGSLLQELVLIAVIGLLLIAAIALTARYWDIHLLRRSHAETARALENETINHILVSATPIGLCIVRLQDDVILTSNQVADSLLNLGKGCKLPAHIVQALRKDAHHDTPGDIVPIAHVVVPAREPEPADPVQGPSDAPQQFIQVTYVPARYQQEDVLFCAVQDVTAQQQLEQNLRAAQQASEAMMRARSNFFASMSHEIRTPLNALLGNLELLARADGMQSHAPRLRALNMASEGLQRIVNDILDFSKIDAGEMKLAPEPFRPIEALESLALSFAPLAADRPIRFYATLMPSLDTVLVGDRTRLAQIINNLLSNAFKFTSCGKIALSAEVTTDAQGRRLLVCRVLDSGIGMPPTLVARVFHPFVQGDASTSSRYGGTGLGLSICARLCDLMGGHITVESVEGVGTAFTVTVPLGSPATPVPARPHTALGGRALVLCQEPEPGDAIGAWLQTAGWRTNAVQTVAAAQAYLRRNRPHVMVVTGDFDLATIAALREIQPAGVAWLTRDGPDRPTRRAPGVYEVIAYSRSAIFAGVEAALDGAGDEADTADTAEADDLEDAADLAVALTDATDDATVPAGPVPPGRSILVVEDNALNQTLIAEQLQALGWHPVVVGDGRQALAMLEQMHADLILTDIHMPVMDGYALLTALRSARPDLPVLAYSAVTHTGQSVEWRARGFAGHIGKPASLRELDQALQAVTLPAQKQEPASPATAFPAFTPDLARYHALLRDHLQTDLPALAKVIEQRDPAALRHWAHRSAGAFMIVQAHEIVALCRALEHLCDTVTTWTPEVARQADALHAAVQAYAEGDTAPQA
ncbi:ATP-binding protein [Cupriavidus campinensis]